MRRTVLLLLSFIAVTLSSAAGADPIGTREGECFTARWVGARATDCDQVCRNVGMRAESMTVSSVGTGRIFVCRHLGRTAYNFGEQGSGNCRIPEKMTSYECLCVNSGCAADDGGSTDRPDPDKPEPDKMSARECLKRLDRMIEKLGARPDEKTYARAQRYCKAGDYRRAVAVIERGG